MVAQMPARPWMPASESRLVIRGKRKNEIASFRGLKPQKLAISNDRRARKIDSRSMAWDFFYGRRTPAVRRGKKAAKPGWSEQARKRPENRLFPKGAESKFSV
jgi:hypothetical protein